MSDAGRPDRLPIVLAGVGLLVVVVIVVLAVYLPVRTASPPPSAPAATVQDLELALARSKKACVEGPPQGPSCAEAARLTTELAKARGTP